MQWRRALEPASTKALTTSRPGLYWTLLTLLRLLSALSDFVAFVTRVAAGLRALLPFDCGAFGVTFFVGIRIHLLPLTYRHMMARRGTRVP
jgi:hypothetical protein